MLGTPTISTVISRTALDVPLLLSKTHLSAISPYLWELLPRYLEVRNAIVTSYGTILRQSYYIEVKLHGHGYVESQGYSKILGGRVSHCRLTL